MKLQLRSESQENWLQVTNLKSLQAHINVEHNMHC
jgi:hypothetical protein